MGGETRDDAEQGNVGIDVEAELFLESGFAARFAAKIGGGIVMREFRVGGWIPDGFVDAVDDTEEVGGSETKHGVEAVAAGGGFDFFGVSGADRGDLGRMIEPGFHHVDLAVGLGAVGAEFRHGDPGEIQRPAIAVALVFQIVDREDSRGVAEGTVSHRGVEHQRDESSGPVVAVDDVGNPVELQAECEGAATQKDETQVVVRVVSPRPRIDFGSVEKLAVLQQVGGNIGIGEM